MAPRLLASMRGMDGPCLHADARRTASKERAEARRSHTVPTDDWQQLELRFTDPIQRVYERIRPIVLFGDSVTKRAEATATPER